MTTMFKTYLSVFIFICMPFLGIAQTTPCTPIITSQSTNAAICAGTQTILTVAATSPNNSALSYTWYKNGTPLTETSNQLTITNFSSSDVAGYYVRVSNTCSTADNFKNSAIIQLSIKDKPTISFTSNQVAVCEETNYTITSNVNTNNGGTPSFQWRKAGVNINNATNQDLTLTSIQPADAALYAIVATNTCGPTTSSNFQLNVTQKPVITAHPVAPAPVCVGGSFTLTAGVTGETSGKWFKDGVDIGVSTKTLQVTNNATINDAGIYKYVATNACGEVTTNEVQLVIKQLPTITSVSAPSSACVGATVTITANATAAGDNNFTYKWSLNNTIISTANPLVIPIFQSTGTYSVEVTNTCGSVTSGSVNRNVTVQAITAPTIATINDEQPCANGTLLINPVVTNLSGNSITYQWFKDGVAITGQNNLQLNIQNIQANQSGNYYLSINNGCNPPSTSNTFKVQVAGAPVVNSITGPTQAICANTTLNISVDASNVQSYQWIKDNQNIGTNSSTYSVSNITTAAAGVYRVRITNNCGVSVTSNPITVTVNGLPTITTQPQSATICSGQPTTFSVTASSNGNTNLLYRWRKDGVEIDGANTSTYTISSAETVNAGVYVVEITNSCSLSPLISSNATLTVNQKPTITVQPVGTSVCVGASLALTANALGATSVKWQRNNVDIGNTTNSINVVATSSDAGRYTFIATNSCGESRSVEALVVIKQRPTINSISGPASVCPGTSITLNTNVIGNGDDVISYIWYRNNALINGATRSSLSINNVDANNVGTYSIEVSNSCGSVTSTSVNKNLLVQLVAKPTVQSVSDRTVCVNESVTISPNITNVGSGNYTYQWYFNGQKLSAQQSAQLSLTNIQAASAGSYYLVVDNGCTPESGPSFNINVRVLPAITNLQIPQSVCVGSPIALSVTATNTDTYEWIRNGTSITGATSADYTFPATLNDAGTYAVKLSNSCGNSLISASKTILVNNVPVINVNQSQLSSEALCEGSSTTKSVVVNNSFGSLTYEWRENNVLISGANSSSYVIQNITAGTSKTYNVTIKNGCGPVSSGSFTITGAKKPTLSISTTLPYNDNAQRNTVCLGKPITISVDANSNGSPTNLGYAWFKNDQDINQNTSNLTINTSQLTDAGVYKLRLTNNCGATFSNSIEIGVNQAPIINTPPLSSSQCEGNTFSLSGSAINPSGTVGDISYTWMFNGIKKSEKSNKLDFSPLKLENTGIYKLIASNECGETVSSDANLKVVSEPRVTMITPLNQRTICNLPNATNRTLTLNVTADNTTEIPNVVWTTNDGLIIGPANSNTVTVGKVGRDATYKASISNACKQIEREYIVINEDNIPDVSDFTRAPDNKFCEGENMTLNVETKTKGYETFNWKLSNGTSVTQTISESGGNGSYSKSNLRLSDAGNYLVDITNACGTITNVGPIQVLVSPKPVAKFDIITADNQCLSGNRFRFKNLTTNANGTIRYVWDFGDGSQDLVSINESEHIYANTNTFIVKLIAENEYGCKDEFTNNVTVVASPRITKQPVAATVCEGAEHTISADIDDGGAIGLSYRWYLNDNLISGVNANALKIISMSAANEGNYKLLVRNTVCGGEVITTPVNIKYQAKPKASFTVSKPLAGCLSDATYTFTNKTTPDLPETIYTWNISDGTAIASKNLTHTFNNTGVFGVTLTANAGGCSTIANIEDDSNKKIVINNKPEITENLTSSKVINKGDALSLNIEAVSPNAAGNSLAMNYAWFKMPSQTSIGNNSNTFSITSAEVSDSGRYYVNISNACGTIKSNEVFVIVKDIPIITKQPTGVTICLGKSLTLTTSGVSTDGNVPFYQWYFKKDLSAEAVPKASGPTLTIDNITEAEIGYYYATLTNDVGSSTTEQVFVGFERSPVINAIQSSSPLADGICANTRLTLNASVSTLTGAGYSLSWLVNDVPLQNQTNSQLVIDPINASHNGKITLVAQNACGSTKSDVAVNVINTPEFAENPSSVSSCLGGDVTFKAKVVTTASVPFAYEWKKIGTNSPITGITSQDQLILNGVQVSDEGFYALQTSNICGVRTSGSGRLTVIATAPIISQHPASISSCAGTSQSMNVIASSDGSALTYSWFKNGNVMADQIGFKIDFASLKASDGGAYRVVVTNACNLSTTSNVSQVVVKNKITLNQAMSDRQICSGTQLDVNLENNLTGAEPSTSYIWKLNNVTINDVSAFTNRIQLASVTEAQNGVYSIAATNSCGTTELSLFTLKVIAPPAISKQPVSASVCAGSEFVQSVQLLNPDQIPVSYQWYQDGTLIDNATNAQLSLQNIGRSNIGLYSVRIANICGVIQSNAARLSIVGNPVITQNPSAINACAGTEASSTILATSDDNQLKYTWYKNDVLINGQTTNKLTFTRLTASDAGTYKAVVTNGCNLSVTSLSTLVYVKDKISLINSIPDIERCVGTELSVDLNTNMNYTDVSSIYQWRLNGVDYVNPTAVSKKLVINSISSADEGQYSVVATNSCGSSTLSLFELNVALAPQITKQPITASVCAGSNFINTVEVANPTQTSLAFQWILDGNIVRNAATQQLSLQNVGNENLGLYAVRVTNICGTTVSASARLSLVGNPVITQNPSDINECSGVDAGTTVVATSSDNTLKYSWFKNDVLLPSQNTNKLSFARLSSTDAGNYKTIVTNGCNLSVSSATIRVLVREKIDVINKLQNVEKCVGSELNIDVSNNLKNADIDALYQWKLNGVDFVNPSATSKKLVINNLLPMHNGEYSLVAFNSCGAADIPMFRLAVVSLPVISGQPISAEVCEKGSWTSSVILANPNQSSVSYQWFKDASPLVNGTNANLTLNNLTAVNTGIYYVRVSSVCGSVNSDRVGLSIKARPRLAINLVNTPPVQCLENNRFEFSADARINDNTPIDITWDFGDGVYSKRVSDGHTYKIADQFNIYLYGKAQNGCMDTAKQNVIVNTRPFIINDLANQVICKNAQLNYTIDVKQLPNEVVAYQWYFNQILLPKETTKSLTVDKFTEVNKGFYSVRITNACGSSNSNEVKVELADKPLFLSSLPIDKKVCEGESIVLKPGVFSLMPVSYQWFKNDLPMQNKELDSLLINGFSVNDIAKYSVRADNTCGTTMLANGNLLMKNVPFTPQGMVTDTLCFASGRVLKIDPIRNNDDTLRISWYLNNQMIQSGTNNQLSLTNFNSFQTGLYKVILSNSCGNVDVPIANLAVNRIRPGFRLDTLDACSEKLRITVTDTSKGFFPITQHYWDIQELNQVLPARASTGYQFTTPGRFTIRHAVVDERGCVSDTVFTRTVNYEKPHAVFNVLNNCLNTVTLPVDSSYFGIGSSRLVRYIWNYGDTVITTNRNIVPGYTYRTPGLKQLRLTVSSDSSCVTDTLEKTFMVYGRPVASFESVDSCKGFPVSFINRSSTAFAPDSVTRFIWNFDDGTTSILRDPVHVFNNYGAFKVRLTAISTNCPNLTDDTVINMSIKVPRANLVYPRVQGVKNVPGNLVAAAGGRSYAWTPFTGLSNTRIQNPTYRLADSKVMYTITIVDSAGCVYKDQQEVWAFDKPEIYIATGFSPNNDGVNDVYIPQYIQIKYLEYFRIADKNNRQIFITNDLKQSWDGTYQGSPLPPDPYVVTVSGIDINGNRITKQGIVVLVR